MIPPDMYHDRLVPFRETFITYLSVFILLKNYYDILGLSKSASLEDIKKAYRRLALKWHPDKNKEGGAKEKFILITEAYDILSDPVKRSGYDSFPKTRYTNGTSRSKPKKSSYEEWMEFQAEKARKNATRKANMDFNKYKKEQFGGPPSMGAFMGAFWIIMGLFGLVALVLYMERSTLGAEDDTTGHITGAFLGIACILGLGFITIKLWTYLRKKRL